MVVGEPGDLAPPGSSSSTAEKGGRLICPPCRGEYYSLRARKGKPRHEDCINDWTISTDNEAILVKREEPIRSCACQHKKSWNFSVSGEEKKVDTDGNSSQP